MSKFIIFIPLLFIISCTTPISQQETGIVSQDTVPKTLSKKTSPYTATIIDSILHDERDQQQYKVKRFDNLWWMIENLNYAATDNIFFKDTRIETASHCLDNSSDNCKKYGRLYSFNAAQNACPRGWRLPNLNEWLYLTKNYSNCYLDETSKTEFYRDTLPIYNPVSGSNAIYQTQYKRLYFYPIIKSSMAQYWATTSKTYRNICVYQIDIEKCKTSSAIVGTSLSTSTQKRFYPCRCVKEVDN